MLYLITFISIIILIFVNGFTDAPNAITSIVLAKVFPFKKAAFLSAIFNSLGIILMCYLSFKVANGISSIITLESGKSGLIALFSSIVACIIFSGISSIFGIPTSETHGLLAGLVGSAIVVGNFRNINFTEWIKVFVGLIWSVFGVFIIVKITYFIFKEKFYKININKIKMYQKCCSFLLSFMHGAQDGQKFIGIIILYISIINNSYNIDGSPKQYIWIIILVSIIMFFGVSMRWQENS